MKNLIRYNPSRTVSPFDRLFDEMFSLDRTWTPSNWTPRVDLSETDEFYTVGLELPGLNKEDVHISFENDVLVVSGERTESKEDEGRRYFRSERYYGSFSRSFSFPKGVNVEGIEARFENGMLYINLPKAEETKPRQIQIG